MPNLHPFKHHLAQIGCRYRCQPRSIGELSTYLDTTVRAGRIEVVLDFEATPSPKQLDDLVKPFICSPMGCLWAFEIDRVLVVVHRVTVNSKHFMEIGRAKIDAIWLAFACNARFTDLTIKAPQSRSQR